MKFKYIVLVLCLSMSYYSCRNAGAAQSHNHETHNHEDNHVEHEDHEAHDHSQYHDYNIKEKKTDDYNHEALDGEIIFTPKQAKIVGLEIEKAQLGDFHQVIKTSGQIVSAQGDEATISATTSGIVSFNKSSLNEGLQVRAGESLLSISSKHIVDGDPAIKAKNAFEIAKREFERAEILIVDKLISETEYNAKKLDYQNAKVSYNAIAKNQTSKGTSMSSPIAGFVKSRLVSEGEFVNVGQPLVTVTQNRRLRLTADVSERYYSSLNKIASANFKTPYDDKVYELSTLNGKMVSYGRSVSTGEYYLPVNFEFNNVGDIISGSYVDVYLISGKKENVLSVPVSALIEDQGAYFVFIQLDAEGYKRQEVKLGGSDGKRVEILSGINVGDIVVAKAAIHVKLASTSSTIPHSHEH